MGLFRKIRNITISIVLSSIILSIIAFAFSYSGVHIRNESGATDCSAEPNQWMANTMEGYAFFHLNEQGLNNSFDLDGENVDILMMGSSHMYALQVPQDKNTAALLNKMMPDKLTYNIGYNGHTLYYCVDNLDSAIKTYQPGEYVIIETMDIDMDIDLMQQVLDGTRSKQMVYHGGSFYMEKYLPGMNLIWQNVGLWRNMSVSSESEAENECKVYKQSDYVERLDAFLLYAEERTRGSECNLMILYHPNISLRDDGTLNFDTDPEKLDVFRSLCEKNEIVFVDMTPVFERAYLEDHILPNGFSNTAVGVGHLNAYGHEMIAETIAEVINGNK